MSYSVYPGLYPSVIAVVWHNHVNFLISESIVVHLYELLLGCLISKHKNVNLRSRILSNLHCHSGLDP